MWHVINSNILIIHILEYQYRSFIGSKLSIYCFQATFTFSTGSSNTGFIRIVTQLERTTLVMKNPPHTAHISHSRLKECRLVLSGTRALPCVLWARRVVCGKYTLYLNRFKHINTYTYHIINTLMDHSAHLNGHKSISIFSSPIPIHLLTTRLVEA